MITSQQLKPRVDAGKIVLLDVRLADDHSAEHIPGAINNCVFEVTFLPRMEEQFPDRSVLICVYGASESSHESRVAFEKLERAGYTNIYELREGLEGWKAFGLGTNGDPQTDAESALEGHFPIDLTESRVEWLGRNLINKHWGTIPLKAGELHFADGMVTGGSFVLDVNGIKCSDLEGSDLHDVLIEHLKSDDFFDTERYPEITLTIDSAEAIEGKAPGEPNLRLHGQLTMRGVTRRITFDATSGVTETGKAAAQAAFSLDRTHWNVIYGSGKFFQRLAGHLVNDLIELQIRIITV